MKTTFTFCEILATALTSAYGQPVTDRLQNACQGALNDPNLVKATEGSAKWNGQIKGGMSVSTAGKLKVDAYGWKETVETDYTANFEPSKDGQQTTSAPMELAKFNGAIASLYRKAGGNPSGQLTVDVLPTYVRSWTDKVAANAAPKVAVPALGNAQVKLAEGTKVEAAVQPAAPKNGNGGRKAQPATA